MIGYEHIMKMYRDGVVAFRMKDVVKATGISEQAIRRDIKKLIKDGIIIEIKKGIYAFSKYNQFQIACAIAKMHTNNYYIGSAGAMDFNKMTEQIPAVFIIITDNYRDKIKIKGETFIYRIRRNKKAFTGYIEKDGVRWSNKAKTVADMFESKNFHDPSGIIEIIRENKIPKNDIEKYFKQMNYQKYKEIFNYVFSGWHGKR